MIDPDAGGLEELKKEFAKATGFQIPNHRFDFFRYLSGWRVALSLFFYKCCTTHLSVSSKIRLSDSL